MQARPSQDKIEETVITRLIISKKSVNYLNESGNVNTAYYIEAAVKLGIDYEVVKRSFLTKFSYKEKHWYFMNAEPPINGKTGCNISMNKKTSTKVLLDAGLPVATQEEIGNSDEAIKFWEEYTDIVLKPKKGIGGKGVNLLPRSKEDVVQAFNDAELKDKTRNDIHVLGEEFIHGKNYRLLVLDDKVLGVVYRKPPVVTGDGTKSIRELIEDRNHVRKKDSLSPIAIDDQVYNCLKTSNYRIDDIPAVGIEVLIRFNSNLSTGGTTVECMEKVHPYYLDLAVNAAKVIDLKLAGVDLIAEDITDPSATCVINELNYCPGLRVHYKVDVGEPVDVALPIMEYTRDFYLRN